MAIRIQSLFLFRFFSPSTVIRIRIDMNFNLIVVFNRFCLRHRLELLFLNGFSDERNKIYIPLRRHWVPSDCLRTSSFSLYLFLCPPFSSTLSFIRLFYFSLRDSLLSLLFHAAASSKVVAPLTSAVRASLAATSSARKRTVF